MGLPRLGIERLAPADGAFYVYADVGHLTDDTMNWCHRLLAEDRHRDGAGDRLRHRGGQPLRAARSPARRPTWRRRWTGSSAWL
jgi:hypothetical protein